MNISLKVIYYLEDNQDSILCFRHAVMAALNGSNIITDVDDFNNEHYLGSTECHMCLSDTFNDVFKKKEFHFSDDDEEDEYDDEEDTELIPKPKSKLETKGYNIKRKKKS